MASIDDTVEVYAIMDGKSIFAVRDSFERIMLLYKNFGSVSEGKNIARVYLKNASLENLDENSHYLIFKDDKLVRSIGPSEVKSLSIYERTLGSRNPGEKRFMENLDFYMISSIERLNEKELAEY